MWCVICFIHFNINIYFTIIVNPIDVCKHLTSILHDISVCITGTKRYQLMKRCGAGNIVKQEKGS